QPRADLGGAFAGLDRAHRLDRGRALAGEQVLAVHRAQRERRVEAGARADRAVLVEDREAGLGRVLVDRAAGPGGGQAEDVVVVLDQAPEEQLLDLLDRERRGLGVGAALGDVRDRKSTRLNSSHVKISYAVF